jgi:tellurite resistance protein TerC
MIWLWTGFILLILALLALDLGVFHRRDRAIGMGEALAWSGFWISLALVFNVAVFFIYEHDWMGVGYAGVTELDGSTAALQFFTGFVVEKSLSLDNIFVIALIFAYFQIPLAYQHRVLFWGILGALILRGIMIAAGAALILRFDWMAYVFGGLLLFTAVRMLVARHDNLEPEKSPVVRLARRLYPVAQDLHGNRFFVVLEGRRTMTPLFLVLILVEATDILFAIDSIPAIFAITTDPFLVFTSNAFAILGLRSLYFALAPLMDRFRFLKTSLVFLLAFVGVKMILTHHWPIPTPVSLAVITGILGVGIVASFAPAKLETAPLASPVTPELEQLVAVSLGAARKIMVLLVGSTVLLIGAALLVLPGPAFLVIPIGLVILGTEFVWARRLLSRLKREVQSIALRRLGRNVGQTHGSGPTPG